ncbi:MAG: CotH kinase family protein [Flavobacteriales bacterium]|nr:CotH kinase family protein [Flavobacteriales bacterium]
MIQQEPKEMNILKPIFFYFLALVSFELNAQVVLNEFSAANYNDWDASGFGDYEDWVELYNPTGGAINIGGYFLSDQVADPGKFEIPAGTTVPANGYLTIICTGLFEATPNMWGFLNTNFKVNQTQGESFLFSDPGMNVLSSFTFGTDIPINSTNHSYGRDTDGSNNWVIFTNPTPGASNGGPTGVEYASKPTIDVQAGYYGAPITVTCTSDPGTTLYYTLNGNEPSNASTLYAGPINISTTTVLRVVAYSSDPNVLPSRAETNTYFFGADNHTVPVVSICGNTLSDGAWGGDELTTLEFFHSDGSFWVESHGDSNEHGNDSNAYGQRGFDYITRDEMGHDYALDAQLFHVKDRNKFQRLIFKAAANDNYPFRPGAHIRDSYVHTLSHKADLHLDERTSETAIVYINGQYWGVYDYREKVDDLDFTEKYYDQPRNFVDFIKTWGGTWNEYGSNADWNTLVNFITTNDMTDPANYDYVTSVYNTNSLIDYFILNSAIVSTDWLNWNTAWWRGRHPDGDAKRWRYALWDMDATFDGYFNYTGVPNTGPDADPCAPDNLGNTGGQGHVPVLNALMGNDEFFADYINRWADLSNTYLNCDYMNYLLDSMITVIEPEMPRQIARWGGTVAEWEGRVQQLRDFIDERCEEIIFTGLEDCYDVTAVNLTIEIVGIGAVQLETYQFGIDESPFSGTYFAGLPIELEADDLGMGAFLYWEVVSGGVVIADSSNPNIEIELTEDTYIIAYFVNNFDPQAVMFDVVPAGAGDILLDGNIMAPYPNTQLIDVGAHGLVASPATIWYVFDHWETINATITPDEFTPDATTSIFLTDTIIAFFNELEHYEIFVDVEPAGAGYIQMNGTDLSSYPWQGEVGGGVDVFFNTFPVDEWSVFSHWEVDNHVISPDEFATNMSIFLSSADSIIAVYDVIPHFSVVVKVEPAIAGAALVNDMFIVNDEWAGELAAGEPLPFIASPETFWYFDRWEAQNHVALPNPKDAAVSFNIQSSDTIIAYFVEEPFTMFIPNSFTPNNDGRNDVFLPVGRAFDVDMYELLIFNRWGEVVFRSNDPTEAWLGEVNKGDYYVEDEIYLYRLSVKPIHSASPEEFSGHIVVFR